MLDNPRLRLISFEHVETNIYIYKEDQMSSHPHASHHETRSSCDNSRPAGGRKSRTNYGVIFAPNTKTQKIYKPLCSYIPFAIFQFIHYFLTLAAPLEL